MFDLRTEKKGKTTLLARNSTRIHTAPSYDVQSVEYVIFS